MKFVKKKNKVPRITYANFKMTREIILKVSAQLYVTHATLLFSPQNLKVFKQNNFVNKKRWLFFLSS